MKPTLLLITGLVMGTVALPADVLLNETFSYPDGPIVGATGSPWSRHSGTEDQANVVGGHLILTQSETEDINALLSGAPFSPESGGSLYARFSVRFDSLPSGSGEYFAHFRNTGTQFRARVFASTLNAAAGTFRLGIGNSSGADAASGQIETDLSLGVSYTVVTRYDLASGLSTVWLNPLAESDPGVTATDAPAPVAISTFAFRQANGIGALQVDSLLVGTSFAEVVPEPSTWMLFGGGLLALLAARARSCLR